LEKAFAELKPTSKTIAQAYALSLTRPPFAGAAANYMTLDARLQVALMEEHVAAQRTMSATIERLTRWLVALTVALLLFTGALVWLGVTEYREHRTAGPPPPAEHPGASGSMLNKTL
jgi:hypothetical protein